VLRRVADDVVCIDVPDAFFAVGQAYADFHQVPDAEVVALLAAEGDPAPIGSGDVVVTLDEVRLPGVLTVPERPRGLVLFAHGSGSSRHSPRNRFVAEVLNEAGLATFLFDLLTHEEARDRTNVFDIGLLGTRLADATVWLRQRDDLAALPFGYFGASTGAAAALTASLDPRVSTAAVVSRGGRPDLVGERLREVKTPTLLIVGGNDHAVLDMNRSALALIPSESDLSVVPGATHLFEEPGTLELAAALARDWFLRHLG
jgi:pimeloyl-ACP methyl ester carboxylesterase